MLLVIRRPALFAPPRPPPRPPPAARPRVPCRPPATPLRFDALSVELTTAGGLPPARPRRVAIGPVGLSVAAAEETTLPRLVKHADEEDDDEEDDDEDEEDEDDEGRYALAEELPVMLLCAVGGGANGTD